MSTFRLGLRPIFRAFAVSFGECIVEGICLVLVVQRLLSLRGYVYLCLFQGMYVILLHPKRHLLQLSVPLHAKGIVFLVGWPREELLHHCFDGCFCWTLVVVVVARLLLLLLLLSLSLSLSSFATTPS